MFRVARAARLQSTSENNDNICTKIIAVYRVCILCYTYDNIQVSSFITPRHSLYILHCALHETSYNCSFFFFVLITFVSFHSELCIIGNFRDYNYALCVHHTINGPYLTAE